MKKINIIFLIITLISYYSIAQSPEFFKYQAVARISDGSILANTVVAFRISILQTSSAGTVVYSERHTATTNQFGLVNLAIGSGSLISGNFSSINWSSGVYYIKTEMDPLGGTSYQNLGTAQLLSVPYALFASKSANGERWLSNANDLYAGNAGNIGIGLSSPTNKLHIANFSGASDVKIGYSSSYFDNRLYFGDGDYVYVGEKELDDRLYLRGKTLSIDINGNLGTNGQVLTTNGTLASWQNLPTVSGLWNASGLNIYNSNTGNVGVGTINPNSKLEVKATTSGLTDTLFQVKDYQGNTVFAVFPDGARLYIKEGARAAVGGFAVSGRSTNRAVTGDYLLITPDSARIYVKEGTRATVGGFAVSGRSTNRPTTTSSFMHLTPENYFIGHEAGKSATFGQFNSFIGYQSGYNNTSGYKNYFIGYKSGFNNIDGYSNIFIGDSSGFNNINGLFNIFIGNQSGISNIDGSLNIFIGNNAGKSNQAGYSNIGIGYRSLFANTTGYCNTAVGPQSLANNIEGDYNTAFGHSALSQSTGEQNTSIGSFSLSSNLVGSYNTAIGTFSMWKNTNGNYNTAVGNWTLNSNTLGYNNTAIGKSAMSVNTEGHDNTAVGYDALLLNSTGNYNVALGKEAGYGCSACSSNVFLGYQAGYGETGSNKLIIANSAGSSLIYGDFALGRVGINQIPTTYTLEVGGTIWANGATITSGATTWSDIRYKTNIKTLENSLTKVCSLRGVSYDWKYDDFKNKNFPKGKQIGVIAQEIEVLYPELVVNDAEGYKTVSYEKLTPILIEAIKEQQKEIEDLKIKLESLNQLKGEIEQLKINIKSLQAR